MTTVGSGSSESRKTAFRYLFFASVVLCILGFFSLVAFSHHFIYAPTTPNEASNNIVAWNNHGTYHYITPREDIIKNSLIAFCTAMFLSAALFGYLDQKK